MSEKQIRLACQGAVAVSYLELDEFQGDLKVLDDTEYTKLRDEIANTGFAFAPHIWKAPDGRWKLVDGHQRRRVVARMVEQEGYSAPDLPCVPVEAATMEDAKRRVLQGTSQYGRMTHRGLADFILDSGLKTEQVESSFRLPEVSFPSFKFEFGNGPQPVVAPPAEGPDSASDPLGTPSGTSGAVAGEQGHQSLSGRFVVPPFSVLDTRQGYWKERRQRWLGLGIKSEEGREEEMTYNGQARLNEIMGSKKGFTTGTSVFDPVLTELCYRWFCPKGGTIVDPFAGGSVRGIVANKLGLQYVGGELRREQVEANRTQASQVCADPMPVWHCGDSRNLDEAARGVQADFVFSCPPYADLEVYSDDPQDLSNMGYPDFLLAYQEIIKKACSLLKPDRFAAFVVGEVRGKDGTYYGFVPDTIRAFEKAGLRFYNEAVLLNSIGTLAIRAGAGFSGSRKLGKCHQNVLVFVKGDPKKATEACGVVDVSLPQGPDAGQSPGLPGATPDPSGAPGSAVESGSPDAAGAQ